jgi:hypothetical protein
VSRQHNVVSRNDLSAVPYTGLSRSTWRGTMIAHRTVRDVRITHREEFEIVARPTLVEGDTVGRRIKHVGREPGSEYRGEGLDK